MTTNDRKDDNVVSLRLTGKVTAEDVLAYRALLDEKLAKHDHLGLCIELSGLADVSLDALVPGIKADVDLLRHLKQFQRIAFVSDKHWPATVAVLMRSVAPSLEVELFEPTKREDALAWAAGRSSTTSGAGGGSPQVLRLVRSNRDTVMGMDIDGVVSRESVSAVMADFNAFLSRNEKVRMLVRVQHLRGMEPDVLTQEGLVSLKLAAIKQIERYALVGAPAWMNKLTEIVVPTLSHMEIRTFAAEEEPAAWKWLEAEPVEGSRGELRP